MKNRVSIALLVLFALATVAAAAPVSVFVSVLPQKYFVEQIGGERVDVSALVEKGRDPHVFEPLPAQMAGLATAKAYFAAGVPFEEALLPRVTSLNPELKVYHTDEGIDKIVGGDGHRHGSEDERHENGHERAHGHEQRVSEDEQHEKHEPRPEDHRHSEGADPHIWNGPREVVRMVENILAGLIEIDPEGEEEYTKRHDDFVERLKSMDTEFDDLFRERRGEAFLVFHPAWAYFARDYGLVEVAIETDGKEPKAAELAAIITEAKERGVRVIFISPQFSRRSAEIVAAAVGALVETADPLAAEWEKNIRAVAKAIADAAR